MRLPRKRPLAGEHLVEHHAEGEDVRTGVHRFPLRLLRRHVGGRPEHFAPVGDAGGRGAVVVQRGVGEPREAEVEDLQRAGVGDEHVLGLQVAVNDALLVRGDEAVQDLGGVAEHVGQLQAPGRQLLSQRPALQQLTHDARRAVEQDEVVHREDVRVVQCRGRVRLAMEPVQRVRIVLQPRREELDGDVAIEPRIPRAVHFPHAARADHLEQLVAVVCCRQRCTVLGRRGTRVACASLVRARSRGFHWGDEAVTTPWDRLDELRVGGVVLERLAQAPDGVVNALLEVDGRGVGPQPRAKLLAGHELAGVLEEDGEYRERLIGEVDAVAGSRQLTGAQVEFVRAEAKKERAGGSGVGHRRISPTSTVLSRWRL